MVLEYLFLDSLPFEENNRFFNPFPSGVDEKIFSLITLGIWLGFSVLTNFGISKYRSHHLQ